MRAHTQVLLAVAAFVLLGGCSAVGPPASSPTSASSSSQNPSGMHVSSSEPIAEPAEDVFTPIIGAVLAAPFATPATDDSTHLAHELILTNVVGQPVTLDAVTVRGDGVDVLTLAGDDLTPWVHPSGTADTGRVLAPGQQAVVTLDVVLEPGRVPAELDHRIEFSMEQEMPPLMERTMAQVLAPTQVRDTEPLTIGSPVAGAHWLDGNSCCEVTAHRSAINPINGSLHAPERFAIDFVQLDEQGRIFEGEMTDLESYAFYGVDILAVADGPIVSMEWGLPEETPGANPTGLALAQFGGNHVVQKLDEGHYAFYAHLQGGNPQGLAIGQELTRGEVVGQLGNSGNTDMPHLHFHIMDSPSPLASNGLPFLIETFTLEGTVPEPALMDCMTASVSCEVSKAARTKMTAKSPLYRDVISIPE